MNTNMKKAEANEKILEETFKQTPHKLAITCGGKIMALTDGILSDEIIEKLDVGRNGAFDGMSHICIDKITANIVADILEDIDDSNWNDTQKEAVEMFFDAVNCIQYQTMVKWLDEYRKTHL